MPEPTIRERDPSRPFVLSESSADLTRPLVVQGTYDEDEVLELVTTFTTPMVGSLVRRNITAQPQGGGLWFVDVTYGVSDPNQDPGKDPDEPEEPDKFGPDFTFDLGVENTHITQSIETFYRRSAADTILSGVDMEVDALNQFKVVPGVVDPPGGGPGGAHVVGAADVGKVVRITGGAGWDEGLYKILAQDGTSWTLNGTPAAAGIINGEFQLLTDDEQEGSAPDQKKAIGVTKDKVEGCDIHAPTFAWSRTVPVRRVDINWINRVFRVTGKTNDRPFFGFDRGELLYIGCTGKLNNGRRWDVTHQFLASPNRENIAVTDTIIIPSKRGWDYLWVGYEPEAVGNFMLQVPKAAYVERVYEEADFRNIGIGG